MKKITCMLIAIAIALICAFSVSAESEVRDVSFENQLASELKVLGLFNGVSDTNFDLERKPSRTEALVMLIRLLGDEKTVKEGNWQHPFNDVADWADAYVGYAYETGLTKGVSATKFGSGDASAATYLTFVIRALGFSDAEGDFSWDNPYPFAKALGMLPEFVDVENFWRADAVTVSYAALSANIKNTEQTLAEKLIEKAAFDADAYSKAYDGTKITAKNYASKSILSAEQVYNECSAAVFYIEIQDADGKAKASGSGFFLDESGIAVTNYHVIKGAEKAVITLPGSGVKYDVTGVYDLDISEDWAIIKVDGEGFASVKCNALPVKAGSNVYAIGSPEGLQNTISAGLVSNPRRVFSDGTYIQTSAAISHGSSGGALFNAYGEVIGITSASITDGQNLNFARPISVIADAKWDKAVPFAEYNWNKVEYTYETDRITVMEGEFVKYVCSYDYYTLSGSAPKFSVDSDDYKIAGVCPLITAGELFICGNSVGETTVTISDDVSSDVHTIYVTVVANEEAAPKVKYIPYYESMQMSVGATKSNIVIFAECKLVDEPNDKMAAKYTVKSSNSSIKVEYEFDDNGEPGVLLKVSAQKKAEGKIIISNNITQDIVEIPVVVGDIYSSSYESAISYIVENGEFYPDDEDEKENSYEMYWPISSQITLAAIYYPAYDELCFMYLYNNDSATIYVLLSMFKNGKAEYGIYMPYANVGGWGEINPKTFTGSNKLTFEDFTGNTAFKSQLSATLPSALLSLLYVADNVMLPSMYPGGAISDFGFAKVDFSRIGL